MNNQNINAIKNRDIDNILFSINIISHQIIFNDGNDYTYFRTVDFIIGTNINGVRKYITAVFDDEYTKVSDWYNLFIKFKSKGLSNAFFIISDKNIIFDAFKLAFENAKPFYSIFNNIYSLSKYVSFSYTNDVFYKIRNICLSEDLALFELNKSEFFNSYSDTPFFIDKLDIELNNFIKFFNYPYLIRKHLLSYNFFKDLKIKFRSAANSKPYFTSLDEFVSLLLPTIQTFELRKYCGKSEWNQIINYLYADYKELILCAL